MAFLSARKRNEAFKLTALILYGCFSGVYALYGADIRFGRSFVIVKPVLLLFYVV